jgi:polyisoprenoid-binding protein YceI
MCGGEATATLKRTDFGMKAALGAASDEIRIVIPFEAAKE